MPQSTPIHSGSSRCTGTRIACGNSRSSRGGMAVERAHALPTIGARLPNRRPPLSRRECVNPFRFACDRGRCEASYPRGMAGIDLQWRRGVLVLRARGPKEFRNGWQSNGAIDAEGQAPRQAHLRLSPFLARTTCSKPPSKVSAVVKRPFCPRRFAAEFSIRTRSSNGLTRPNDCFGFEWIPPNCDPKCLRSPTVCTSCLFKSSFRV